MVVGDSASLLNPMRLKGIHTGMKSGMVAAEAATTIRIGHIRATNHPTHMAVLKFKELVEQRSKGEIGAAQLHKLQAYYEAQGVGRGQAADLDFGHRPASFRSRSSAAGSAALTSASPMRSRASVSRKVVKNTERNG